MPIGVLSSYKAESVLFNNTTLANAKGSPLVFITLPVIFCAIIGVIAERHNAVVKITFSLILLQFCLIHLFFCRKSIALKEKAFDTKVYFSRVRLKNYTFVYKKKG